nr:hypothetical protein [Streptomyces tsukubensis NRRL18488]
MHTMTGPSSVADTAQVLTRITLAGSADVTANSLATRKMSRRPWIADTWQSAYSSRRTSPTTHAPVSSTCGPVTVGLSMPSRSPWWKVRVDASRMVIDDVEVMMAAGILAWVDHLARAAAMHPRTGRRRFKEATGLTATEYLQVARIAKARELELTSEPVAQIPRSFGYLSASNFRRLFLRATGVTPSEYRRRFGIAARVDRREYSSAGQSARIRSTPSR